MWRADTSAMLDPDAAAQDVASSAEISSTPRLAKRSAIPAARAAIRRARLSARAVTIAEEVV
jgi:hypothetical protein